MKAIIFDFDGVICESAGIKTQAFRQLFSKWPEHCEAIVDYHIRNSGIDRFVKFKYFFEQLLKQPYTKEIKDQLAGEYSQLVVQGVKDAPFVAGAREFLEEFSDRYLFFIVSATPYAELMDIVKHKAIQGFFKKIYGFPDLKADAIRTILADHHLTKKEAVFIGDGESDWKAAGQADICFVLRRTAENQYLSGKVHNQINDLFELRGIIDADRQKARTKSWAG